MMVDRDTPRWVPPGVDDDLRAQCRKAFVAFASDTNGPEGVDWPGLLTALADRLTDGDFSTPPGYGEYLWIQGAKTQDVATLGALCGIMAQNIGLTQLQVYRQFKACDAEGFAQYACRYMVRQDVTMTEVPVLEHIIDSADIHTKLVVFDIVAALLQAIHVTPEFLWDLRK